MPKLDVRLWIFGFLYSVFLFTGIHRCTGDRRSLAPVVREEGVSMGLTLLIGWVSVRKAGGAREVLN